MKYWFDKSATKNNIVILSAKALVVASADEASQAEVDEQLKSNTHPKMIFGPKGFQVIPFTSIEDLKSISVDGKLDISFKTPKKLVTKQISFDSAKSKLECMGYIKKLSHKDGDKNGAAGAAKSAKPKKDSFTVKASEPEKPKSKLDLNYQAMLYPFLGLILAIVGAYLLYPKINIIALAAGGVGALVSLIFLYLGFKKSPDDDGTEISAKETPLSKLSEKVFGILKPAYIIGLATIAVAALFFLIPDELRGPASLYQAIQTHKSDVSEKTIQGYLDKGADINYMAEDGTTPLITALNFSEETLAIELINNGAALSTQFVGQTPLDLAIEASLDKAVNSMLNKKMVTSNPQDLLLRSISSSLNFENIKLIADSGMDINHQDEEGLTALGMALLFGSEPKVIKLLLDRGASTKFKVGELSPLEFAKLRGYTEISAMLEQHSS
ncbi:ankyrin repeat domain-containing protein [uncultured Cocleimonas sp.]|uniref:ankyrin repeat domain-containing protein n=1 Tax=uncultured Cocleimonas sp. TaxID=1051587 RepID=UPI002619E05A|nr:ankyrin repeat domain-containing protein [uncultured Cocleimonas sp.]